MSQTNKELLPPMNPFVHVPSFLIQSGGKSKLMEGSSLHQRCSSGSFLIEEQPSWFDDLLDDSEPVVPKLHRRSASDTCAYLDKTESVQSKMAAPKTDAKRAKNNRQSGQRSRVRKLQYIAELERNVEALQAEGSGFVAEMEFRDHQNLILSMENQTLRNRTENLSQELLIKHVEHEMLEREIGRLQTLFQLQMHHPQPKTAIQKQST